MKDQCYQFIKGANNKVNIVGFGSYGEVKLAKNTETDEMVAIKMIHGKNAKEEIDVHHKLDHPNVIKLLNYYYEKEKNTTYMVLQYAEGGTLHEKIKFGYGQLPKEKIKKFFKDICKAVEYLHSLKYMHRDIKPQNILLTKNGQAKLCDFGFAAILQYRSTLCGTHQYMAPEMIQEKPYDYKVDIWALGILLFEMIQGAAPFKGETGQDVINEMKKPIVFSNRFDKEEVDLIKKILRVNAENRPDIESILAHPYVKKVKEQIKSPKIEKTSTPNSHSVRTISSTSYQKQFVPTVTKKKIETTVQVQKKASEVQKKIMSPELSKKVTMNPEVPKKPIQIQKKTNVTTTEATKKTTTDIKKMNTTAQIQKKTTIQMQKKMATNQIPKKITSDIPKKTTTPTTQINKKITTVQTQKKTITPATQIQKKILTSQTQKKPFQKQTKSYGLQATKQTTLTSPKATYGNIPSSPNIKATTSYQSFQTNNKSTTIPSTQQPTSIVSTQQQQPESQTIAVKQPSSTSYKQPNISSVTSQKQLPTGQKIGTGISKVGYQKSVTSVTSPTGKTQMRNSGPSTGIVSSKFISSKKY